MNEIRWVCERCMARRGRFIPDSADVFPPPTLVCNICLIEKSCYPVEVFSARYSPEHDWGT